MSNKIKRRSKNTNHPTKPVTQFMGLNRLGQPMFRRGAPGWTYHPTKGWRRNRFA